ncbi:unnamed protein product [Clonostachys chloroleuca]|uniref:Uncharacterized protein n=1 Tax=Clonostachys chloroleuca TaxID=1926264 RepID=A0AA35QBS4_9HYPO|nr:unnamed protein product [Clonostachys chloroleuca]
MAPDRIDAVAPLGSFVSLDTRQMDPSVASAFIRGDHAVSPPAAIPEARASASYIKGVFSHGKVLDRHDPDLPSRADGDHSQSDPRSIAGSQESNVTSVSDQIFTPTQPSSIQNSADSDPMQQVIASSQDDQLLQLSELAAGRQRLRTDSAPTPRKRMADGELKSPYKSHSRNASAVSAVSTASTVGDMAQTLKSRLSWAMYKYKNGLEEKSIDEIETIMSSQSSSPVSTVSTTRTRPVLAGLNPQMRVHFAKDIMEQHQQHVSDTPITSSSAKPIALAPPAPIRPSISSHAPRPNPRRNSNPHYMPTFLTASHQASPRTPAQPSPLGGQSRALAMAEGGVFSAHHNNREKDAVETLMFLSSPNNSANLKHDISPSHSPGPFASQDTPRSSNGRHALPSGPRKALPTHRPDVSARKALYRASSNMSSIQGSPMILDSPHSQSSPYRGTPRSRFNGDTGHVRGALSLPSPLGWTSKPRRKPLTEEDVLKMLDRNTDDMCISSDDEGDIEIPGRRNGAGISPS